MVFDKWLQTIIFLYFYSVLYKYVKGMLFLVKAPPRNRDNRPLMTCNGFLMFVPVR